MRLLSACLFDLDGTLLDSVELILESFRHTARVHGAPPRSDAEWLAGVGRPLADQLRCLVTDGRPLEDLVATFREFNLARHDALARAYPGASEAVRALGARGVKLALVTSKLSHGTDLGLRLLGLEHAFGAVVCADHVRRGKPDPEPVRMALAQLGVEPRDAVFVGDSPHDMQAGRAAGVRTAAALWGPFGREALTPCEPDEWLAGFDGLRALPFVEAAGGEAPGTEQQRG